MAVPKVSIILTVWNGVPLLNGCIQSVLAQTMADFEFIIIDDGSTDETWNVINSYGDARIRAFTQKNVRMAASANRGVSLARAPYIARIDHDDLMMPRRLEQQLQFLEANPSVALVGSFAQLIYDDTLSSEFYRAPITSAALRLRLIFENPITQPSVMMRTEVVRALGGYNEDRRIDPAEDFELWSRIAYQHELATIGSVLIHYRIRADSASHRIKSIDHNVLISAKSLQRFLEGQASADECFSLAAIFHRLAGDIKPLNLKRALAMFDRVTDMIAGARANWNTEVEQVYKLQRRMIFFHYFLRRRPGIWIARHFHALKLR